MLNEITEGECSLETAQFIKELSWPIDEEKLGIIGHIPEIFAVKVNVSDIFAPGHLYVALSRVRCRDAIQVVGFNRNKVIRLIR